MVRVYGDAAAKALRELIPKFTAAAAQTLGQSAAFSSEVARKTTAFKDRTGAGRASIVRVQKSEWAYQVRVGGAKAPYMLFIEDGSKAHDIVAKKARVLSFVVNGQRCFAKRVHHPGTKATHFMLDARNQGESALHRFITNGMTAALH